MKRFLFLLIIAGSVISTQAQVSLADLLKGKTGDDVTVLNPSIDAVYPELVIIRQRYRLERDGERFGRNNKPFYGETYTLGIKVSGGMIMQNRLVCPWLGDADYQRVNRNGKYTPELLLSDQKGLKDSVYTSTRIEFGSDFMRPVDSDSLIYRYTASNAEFGLAIDETSGAKAGYMIWAYASTELQDSAMTASLKQRSYSVTASADSIHIKMSPSDAERVIGGLYVVPRYDRSGRVQFMLTGVAAKDNDNNWILTLFTKHGASGNVKGSDNKDVTKVEADPTPIKKTKKRK